jgi:hypothetical protein
VTPMTGGSLVAVAAPARDVVGMSRHLAERLLKQPLERLGRDADGRDGKLIRELLSL